MISRLIEKILVTSTINISWLWSIISISLMCFFKVDKHYVRKIMKLMHWLSHLHSEHVSAYSVYYRIARQCVWESHRTSWFQFLICMCTNCSWNCTSCVWFISLSAKLEIECCFYYLIVVPGLLCQLDCSNCTHLTLFIR